MSLPDYEGKDYVESDPDEPDLPPTAKKQNGIFHATDNRNALPSRDTVTEVSPVEGKQRSGHSRTASENEGGALDDLLDDYSYGTSQPNTPGVLAPAEFSKRELDEGNHEEVGTGNSQEPAYSSTVTNIRRVDANPQRLSQSTMSSQPPPPPQKDTPPQDDPSSFATSVLKALDSPEKSKSSTTATEPTPPQDSPSNTTKRSNSPPKSPTPSSQDTYASSNYWAQMRANLKTKRSVSQEPSRPPSHKTDSTTDLPTTTNKSNRSSNESVRSNPPKPPLASNDGRSGSFTSYTPPPPKFPDQRRPSSPFGRATGTRPTIDTGAGRTVSLTSVSPPGGGEWGQRRGSASDVKNPVIDVRPPTGNRSASNSPVTGSMPFSANGNGGARPGSRGRSRGDDVYGGDLPVFAPRDGLPLSPRIESPARGPARPQSPSRGPPRPQSPSRGPPRPQSPSRVPPRPQSPSRVPPRPQSPSRVPPRPASPGRGVSPGRGIPLTPVERDRRTPSPLKDIPEEIREMEDKELNLPPVNRTPSPLRKAVVPAKESTEPVHIAQPGVPPKDLPVPPKDIAPVIAAALSQPPPPPQLEKKDVLPPVPAVAIPIQTEVERSRSPSPDAEWRDDQEDEGQPENEQPKRITVFLQEHGKRKESQGLPPLPTEPPPPLPSLPPLPTHAPPSVPREPTPPIPAEHSEPVAAEPPQPVEAPPPIPSTQLQPTIPINNDDPVERLKKHFEEPEPPSPLIPPPKAPILDSRSGMTPSASDSSIESHTATATNPVNPTPAATEPIILPPVAATHRSIPSSSSIQHSIQHSRSASAVTPITHSREASTDSPIHQLPELDMDVSRPITWGPLTFEQALQTPGKEEMDPMPVKEEKERLDDVDEESDWEKVEEEDTREEPLPPSQEEAQEHETEEPPPPAEVAKQPDHEPPEIPDAHPMSAIADDTAEATAPPDSDPEDQDEVSSLPDHHTHKSPHPDDASNPASSDIEGDHPTSRYRDRDITSFIIQSRGLHSRDSEKPMSSHSDKPPVSRDSDRPVLAPLQTNPVPVQESSTRMTMDFLPPFMLGKDIPDMSSVAQRVGAYQSRREQMVNTDTGLRGWLLQWSQSRPSSLPQRTPHCPLTLLIVEPPDLRRLSKDSFGAPASPSTSALPFTGSGKVGRKMISKMVIGGKKLGAATKNTIDKLGTGDKRTSGDIHYGTPSGEGYRGSPTLQQQRLSREESVESPVVRSSGLSQERIEGEPELKDIAYGSQAVGLGVSTPTQATPMESEPRTSFGQMQLPPQRPESPYQPPRDDYPATSINNSPRPSSSLANPVISKKESQGTTRHKFSSSISSAKVSKLFGITTTSPDSKPKHLSDTSDYPTTSPQQSPKQKSKFSKFVNDLSQSSITGKPQQQQINITASPPPPPPPDKSQFRSPSEGSRLKGFLTDLSSRDITGNKPQTSHVSPNTSPRVATDRPNTGGFGRFIAELGKPRDIMGHTEDERLAATRRREQELTHVPAQAVVYDESASDWEVKLERMEDVLPHIRRDILVDSLKEAGGDEQRAIGLAVIKSR